MKLNKISFYLNDKQKTMMVKPNMTIMNVLQQLGFLGTKESCAEGDCGSCTVALNKIGKLGEYEAITSCIAPATKLHKRHLITIEGLGTPDNMHFIQRLLYENHGTQCGYCTPGIIMSIFARLTESNKVNSTDLKKALEGNICRCTGYQHIVQANDAIVKKLETESSNILPEYCDEIIKKLAEIPDTFEQFEIDENDTIDIRNYFVPHELDELFTIIKEYRNENVKIIAGATDLFVEKNIHNKYYQHYIDISSIIELQGIDFLDNVIEIGATETLENVMKNDEVKRFLPALANTLNWMSSRQIRNVATIAGNIGNASPIGDATTALLGLEASLQLISPDKVRTVKLSNYFHGYKDTELRKDEIIAKIIIPIQKEERFYNFIKTSKRRNLDIATVNSLCNIEVDKAGIIKDIKLAYGGVFVYPKLAHETQKFLIGKKINELNFSEIENYLQDDYSPISDVRGSEKYRNLVIKNQLIKHINTYLETSGDKNEK